MNTIQLKYVIPHVFANREQQTGDIWQHDVTLERGRTYLLEADSGQGKSTFCSYLVGYRSDYTGQLLFDGQSAHELTVGGWTALRRRHVSLLFQELRLFPELTARENVDIKNQLTSHLQGSQIDEWFSMLGIADKQHQLVGHLSFGQQQRVALIRALAQPFDFLLVDEPISHLDDHNARLMADIMTAEATRQGAALIVTSIGKHPDIHYDHILRL